jgi:hypothetical protein
VRFHVDVLSREHQHRRPRRPVPAREDRRDARRPPPPSSTSPSSHRRSGSPRRSPPRSRGSCRPPARGSWRRCAGSLGRSRRRANPRASTAPRRAPARPARSDATIAAPRSIETPTTRARGSSALIAAAMPEISPPPESGTSTQAASGASSAISRPIVPCPAMTSGWSKGGIGVRPSSASSRSTSAWASSWECPTMRISPPAASTARSLLPGTSEDMQITARTPSARAAWARARPWLPVDAAATPRARRSRQRHERVRRAPELEAARRLVMLKLQQHRVAPARAVRAALSRSGVRWMRAAIRSRAARTAATGTIAAVTPPRARGVRSWPTRRAARCRRGRTIATALRGSMSRPAARVRASISGTSAVAGSAVQEMKTASASATAARPAAARIASCRGAPCPGRPPCRAPPMRHLEAAAGEVRLDRRGRLGQIGRDEADAAGTERGERRLRRIGRRHHRHARPMRGARRGHGVVPEHDPAEVQAK